jgi:hypothetical protein
MAETAVGIGWERCNANWLEFAPDMMSGQEDARKVLKKNVEKILCMDVDRQPMTDVQQQIALCRQARSS